MKGCYKYPEGLESILIEVKDFIQGKMVDNEYNDCSELSVGYCYISSVLLKSILDECYSDFCWIIEYGEMNGNDHYWISGSLEGCEFIVDIASDQFDGNDIEITAINDDRYNQIMNGSMHNFDDFNDWKHEFMSGRFFIEI